MSGTPARTDQDFDSISTASVSAMRPSRYGQQLVGHMTRKISGDWDQETSTGTLSFDRDGRVTGTVDLSCEEGALIMRLRTGEADRDRLEQVVGIHLARFGWKEGLAVVWQREDGTDGTRQGPLTKEDLERMSREREARRAARA